jgi:H+/Cl- antiporter ClcA
MAGLADGAYAMVGAAAVLGASRQAPVASLVLVLQLTHSGFWIMVLMIVATVVATAVARRVDGYPIYSARLEASTKQLAEPLAVAPGAARYCRVPS